jgi:hypothetical protein
MLSWTLPILCAGLVTPMGHVSLQPSSRPTAPPPPSQTQPKQPPVEPRPVPVPIPEDDDDADERTDAQPVTPIDREQESLDGTQPTDGSSQPDDAQKSGAFSQGDVLARLHGTWRVDVTVNPELWPEVAAVQERDVSRDREVDDASASRARKEAPQGVSFSGFAHSRLLLNGTVLEEVMVIPGLPGRSETPALRVPRENPAKQVAAESQSQDAFQGLMLITYDHAARGYNAILIDSRVGRPVQQSGVFNTQSKRLIFGMRGSERRALTAAEIAEENARGPQDDRVGVPLETPRDRELPPNPNTGTGGTSDSKIGKGDPESEEGRWPRGTSNSRVGRIENSTDDRPSRRVTDADSLRLVLEIIDDHTHRVTAYKTMPDRADRDSNAPRMADAMGEIIYTAVFTRVQGADATAAHDMINASQRPPAQEPPAAR